MKTRILLSVIAIIMFLGMSAILDAQTLRSHDFNNGKLAPFNACSVSSPNYTINENGRVKTFWTPDEYDGSRSMRGAELCCDDVVVHKHGWYGITVNLGADYQTNNTAGIGQVFQFSSETFWSWVVMMDMIEGDLCLTHRGPSSGVKTETVLYPNFPKETDMNIIIGFTLSHLGKGEIQVWINEKSVYHATNISLGFGTWDSNDVQTGDYTYVTFKVGQYNFNAATYITGDTETVYYDNISFYNGDNGYDVVNPQGDRFKNKVVSASVGDDNPKQVVVEVTDEIKDQDTYEGFTVQVDDVPAAIESISLLDPLHIVITLTNAITKDNMVSLSYEPGNIVSESGRPMVSFENVMVDNLLSGAAPVLKSVITSESGTLLQMSFSKKMQLLSSTDTLKLIADYQGIKQIDLINVGYYYNDTTILNFKLSERVYNDYNLYLSYNDTVVTSLDRALLSSFSELPVTNISRGLPFEMETARVDTSGLFVDFKFNRKIADIKDYSANFSFSINNAIIAAKLTETKDSTISVYPMEPVYPNDEVTASYTPGASARVVATNTSELGAFTNVVVENRSTLPLKFISSYIEAENYNGNSGTSLETCTDTGGGEDVGSIKNGNWLMYSNIDLNNVSGVEMRLASAKTGGTVEIRLGSATGTLIGTIEVPNTGDWQAWETVSADLQNTDGTYDVYLVFKTAGSWVGNINWLQFYSTRKIETSINEVNVKEGVTLYPNPVGDYLVIEGNANSKVSIYDPLGQSVFEDVIYNNSYTTSTAGLQPGIYLLRIRKENLIKYGKFIKK